MNDTNNINKKIAFIQKKLLALAITILFAITGCVHNNKTKQAGQNQKTKTQENIPKNNSKTNIPKEKHVINVWIHGTRLIQDHIFKSFFYRKMGLHHAHEYLDKHNHKQIAKKLSGQKTKRFTFDNFYFFGWSGQLDHEKREIAANKLYKSLLELVKNYKAQYGVIPKIRLITHSHGGNVALCFGKINDNQDKPEEKVTISELVLLACPVQEKTSHAITSKTFKKVYSIYSGLDMIQVIDPQGLHEIQKTIKNKIKKPLFSQRIFTPRENLTQLKIRVNNRGILHLEFLQTKFAILLPYILQELDAWEQQETSNPQAYKQVKYLKIRTQNKSVLFTRKYKK